MATMKITKELKILIEKNQDQLKAGIRNHQRLLAMYEGDPENTDIEKQLQTEQEHIIVIGLEQKVILDKLRTEYKLFRKLSKINGTKNSINDKRFNLTIALRRAKKQTVIQRPNHPSGTLPPPPSPHTTRHHRHHHHHPQQPSPPPSPPDALDSTQHHQPPIGGGGGVIVPASHSSPEPPPPPLLYTGGGGAAPPDVVNDDDDGDDDVKRPLLPQDVGQVVFLQYLQLATHDVFREMQCKRVERKRRSTANPQFLYTRGWDISKRKRNFYLSNLTASPPTTRQSVRSKVAKLVQQSAAGERTSPPTLLATAHHGTRMITGGLDSRSGSSSPTDMVGAGAPITRAAVTLPGITHLPSGLTIEPIREEQTICIECKQPGNLTICDECAHAFHVACHNRPLVSTPRHCPICYTDAKEARLRQQMAQHATSPITIMPPTQQQQQQQQQIEEKLDMKASLLNRNKQLTAQLTELQHEHSKLTISLRSQEQTREDLMSDQDCTKDKIHRILTFISKIKSGVDKSVDQADDDDVNKPDVTVDSMESDRSTGKHREIRESEVRNVKMLNSECVFGSDEREMEMAVLDRGDKDGDTVEAIVRLQGSIEPNLMILNKMSAGSGDRPKVVVIQQSPSKIDV